VLVANDHSAQTRSLIIAANEFDINTNYIQHSTVSRFFPDINIFDNVFLDGQQAWDVYNSISLIKCNCFIVGAVRLGPKGHSLIDAEKLESRVNIAINDTINIDSLKLMLESIESKFTGEYKFFIRLHPRQSARFEIEVLCNEFDVEISSNDESLESFLCKSLYLVTVSSGIVIDALRFNVLPIMFLAKEDPDYFNFIERKVVIELENLDLSSLDISSQLNSLQEKAQYFDRLIGQSSFEISKSVELINKVVCDI
jgi:hypothetical protein